MDIAFWVAVLIIGIPSLIVLKMGIKALCGR